MANRQKRIIIQTNRKAIIFKKGPLIPAHVPCFSFLDHLSMYVHNLDTCLQPQKCIGHFNWSVCDQAVGDFLTGQLAHRTTVQHSPEIEIIQS